MREAVVRWSYCVFLTMGADTNKTTNRLDIAFSDCRPVGWSVKQLHMGSGGAWNEIYDYIEELHEAM